MLDKSTDDIYHLQTLTITDDVDTEPNINIWRHFPQNNNFIFYDLKLEFPVFRRKTIQAEFRFYGIQY